MHAFRRICVFCGSSHGTRAEYTAAARSLGHELAEQGIGLVYGGSDVGLMGELAEAVLERKGEAIGVIPELFSGKVAHPALTELHVVKTMHERKTLMFELSDGCIALPGGVGTMEELMEVLTWAQLGIHDKPCGLLNTLDYYSPLLAFLDHSVEHGFVRTAHREMLLVASQPSELLAAMRNYQVPPRGKGGDSGAAPE